MSDDTTLTWAAKAGRRISAATREAIQAAIEALTALLGEADEKEQARAAAALEKLFGEDQTLITEMMSAPAKSIEFLQVRAALAVKRADAMIALFLPQSVAQRIAWPPDETGLAYQETPTNELHITLAYFDEWVTSVTQRDSIVEALKKFAAEFPPIVGRLSGGGEFASEAESPVYPIYANVDAPRLAEFREAVLDVVREFVGARMSNGHGFTPHVTLAYVNKGAEVAAPELPPLEMTFGKVCLVWGNDRYEFELTGSDWAFKAKTDDAAHQKTDAAIRFDIEAPCAHKAIKVVSAGARRIGAYATVWGEQDCDADRMLKEAIEPYVGKGAVPLMLWMHGLDAALGNEIPGVWDGKSFKLDDIGLYVEGNVFHSPMGDKAWSRLETAGSFGLSVGSAWYLVKRQKGRDGTQDITDWPLLEISIMEGGKQCVPSAQRQLGAGLEALYRKAAVKFGVKWAPEGPPTAATPGQGVTSPKRFIITKGKPTMPTEIEIQDADLDALLEKKLAAREEKKASALKSKQDEDARIEARATELAEAKRPEIEKQAKDAAEKEARKNGRPTAPNVGVPVNVIDSIKVGSPYDRLDTLDLCLRYEIMRSYGKRPSVKHWRALGERAVKMSREEDTLYIKNGQAVKKPAIDWQGLTPRGLDLNEINSDLFASKGLGDRSEDNVTPTGIKQLHAFVKSNELVYSTQANAGDEWVPTLMNAQLWRTVRLNAGVLNLFDQIDMPSQPYDYPVESTDPVFYKVGEATDESQLILTGGPFTDSKPGTAKVTFSAGKIGAISYWSEEQEEDGIIAAEPQFRDQYGMKMAHVIDELLISGDEATGSANISYDGASISAASRFLVVDGLRDQALVVTSTDSRDAGALTIDDFGATQALMGVAGKFGVNPNDLVFILDPAVWHKAKLLPEVLTVDKFGSMATVLTGQLGALLGVPLLVSEDFGLTDTAGKISSTGGSNTKGSFLCVNRRGVMVGWRRRPRIRVVGLPGAEARFIVGSARFDIQFREVGMAALSFNVTV